MDSAASPLSPLLMSAAGITLYAVPAGHNVRVPAV